MSDIVARLRYGWKLYAKDGPIELTKNGEIEHNALLDDAADEIVRLRARLNTKGGE
jgi:hypothetical protein